jgi:hypothetical protein
MSRCLAADLTRYPQAEGLAPCRLETEGRCSPSCKRAKFLLKEIDAKHGRARTETR